VGGRQGKISEIFLNKVKKTNEETRKKREERKRKLSDGRGGGVTISGRSKLWGESNGPAVQAKRKAISS